MNTFSCSEPTGARRAERFGRQEEEHAITGDADDAYRGDDHAGDGDLDRTLAADQVVDPAAQKGAGNGEQPSG